MTARRRPYFLCESLPPERAKPITLPEFLRPLFWDVEFEQIRWPEHADTVVRRIMEHGGMDAIRWALTTVGRDTLGAWLSSRHGAGIDKRRLRLWQVILGLPSRRVTAWLRRPERQVWDGRATCTTKS